jgi:hypothetical protein
MDRRQTPHVINPKQGWLSNWNNVPSEGWTAGDSAASERNSGRYHRGTFLTFLARELMRAPDWRNAEIVVEKAGTYAQQRPLLDRRLRLARFGSAPRRDGRRTHEGAKEGSPEARVLDALLDWGGSYHHVDGDRTVHPGVAIWEVFKERSRLFALRRLGAPLPAADHLSGKTGLSHEFDITNGEAYAMRTLSPAGYRVAAADTFVLLSRRFGTDDISRWREPRRMYKVTAQGAAKAPQLPFFDRGTWEQLVEVAPG